MMRRRTFIKFSAALGFQSWLSEFIKGEKSHILTLSFDDGFKNSFYKIADIYEKHNLQACLNVIASGHFPDFQKVDDWILPELMGSFDDWNKLKKRGHEIMPHSWKHLNLARQPVSEAKMLILKCLDYFEEHLEGYDPKYTVFNFPFNSSTPELEEFVLSHIGALRSSGDSAINSIPVTDQPVRLSCWSRGPQNQDDWVASQIDNFLNSSGGWLILNLHGLDNEGWGPISPAFLNRKLEKLVSIDKLAIMPAGEVLRKASGL